MYSTIVTSLVQAAAALFSFLILGVPNAAFLTILTFFFGLIPMLGASIVPFVLSVWMYFDGRVGPAVFLFLWSVLVVGLMDNVLKPLLMKGRIRLHEAVIFFALLGGLAVFGPVGVLVGPLIVALHVATVRIYRRDYSAKYSAGRSSGGLGGPPIKGRGRIPLAREARLGCLSSRDAFLSAPTARLLPRFPAFLALFFGVDEQEGLSLRYASSPSDTEILGGDRRRASGTPARLETPEHGCALSRVFALRLLTD